MLQAAPMRVRNARRPHSHARFVIGPAQVCSDFFMAVYVADSARVPMSLIDWSNTRYDEKAVKGRFHESGWASLIVDDVLHRE